jgi:hypothetical protein
MPMPMTATFPGAKFTNSVTGYRVSLCYQPGLGFQGQFYVYVHVRVDASTEPGVVDLGADGQTPKGSLQLSGGHGIDHTFPDIKLTDVEDVATRAEKFRLLEFQYDPVDTDTNKKRPKFANTWKRQVQDGRLGKAYKFNLGGGEENVLAYAARRSAMGANVLRFTTLANNIDKNSWFAKVFKFVDDAKDFVVPFGNEPIKVSPASVSKIYLDETYGELLDWPMPALRRYSVAGAGDLVRMDVPAYTSKRLLEHENQPFTPQELSDVVQTATFVFNAQGQTRNIRIP